MAHHIVEEPFGVFVETVQCKSHSSAGFLVVRGRHLVSLVLYRGAQMDIRPLVAERVAGEHAQDAPHGIPAVEGGLRPAQHVDALHVEQLDVVGTLVGISHVIHIQSHGRRVDARAHAADVGRRGQAAAIVRHVEVGHVGRHFLERLGVPGREVGLVEERHGGRQVA